MATPTEAKKNDSKQAPGAFESKLSEGRQRFLAHAIEHGLGHGRRTPEDFIRHFPPAAIMNGLRDQPQLRSNILVIATGVRAKIALKKPAESCGIDLQIALDEGETDAETVVQLFDPDDRVRYLDSKALWSYVTEGNFWGVEPHKDRTRHSVAAEHMAFMIVRGLKDGLLTHRDVIEGITVAKLAEHLPRTELEKIISAALKAGNTNKPYVESNLLGAAPPMVLVQHIPLPWIWDQVIVPKIAEAHGFSAKRSAAPEAEKVERPEKSISVEMPPVNEDSQEVTIEGVAEPSTATVPAAAAAATPSTPPSDLDLEVDDVLSGMDEPAPIAPTDTKVAIPRPPVKRG